MFREKIKMAIGQKNLRIKTVSFECKIIPTSLSSYLNGQRGLRYEQIETLVEYLGLSLVPKREFHFHSDFLDRQEEEREAKIAARRGA